MSEQYLLLAGGVRTPQGEEVRLEPEHRSVLGLCDGHRTVREIAGELWGWSGDGPDRLRTILATLVDRGLVRVGLAGPIELRPEQTLAAKLAAVGRPDVRGRSLDRLQSLLDARSDVARAAGDPAALVTALGRLDAAFEAATATAATRRPGEMYAGRRLVYEDARRDLDVEFGRRLLAPAEQALELVLESAQWFVGRAADLYANRFLRLYRGSGGPDVPLAMLLARATPDIAFLFGEPPRLLEDLIGEFGERWAQALGVPSGARRHAVRSADVRAAVLGRFPELPPRWSSAMHHSIDLMVAARGVPEIDAGDFTLVLGEIHAAANTLSARAVLSQHDDPAALLRADEADHGQRRVVPVPGKESAQVNTRVHPPALLSPGYTYWATRADTTGAPGPVLPIADLVVREGADGLVVASVSGAGTWDLLEVVGEHLSVVVGNNVGFTGRRPHQPRVTIDRLVVSRESWTFRPAEIDWAVQPDPARRYGAARRWRAAHGLPDHVFYRVPGETKPLFADLTSPVFVDVFAGLVRRTPAAGSVRLSEMLPTVADCWLRHPDGARHTSELRLVFADPRHAATAAGRATGPSDPGSGAR